MKVGSLVNRACAGVGFLYSRSSRESSLLAIAVLTTAVAMTTFGCIAAAFSGGLSLAIYVKERRHATEETENKIIRTSRRALQPPTPTRTTAQIASDERRHPRKQTI
jgi:hypothetical protein